MSTRSRLRCEVKRSRSPKDKLPETAILVASSTSRAPPGTAARGAASA